MPRHASLSATPASGPTRRVRVRARRALTLGATIACAVALSGAPTLLSATAATVTGVSRVSVSSAAAQGAGYSDSPSISADGRFVAFYSAAANLVAGDTNFAEDVFVRDRQTSQTTRISLSTAGSQSDAPSLFPVISADGRYVAFSSFATNLVSGAQGNVDLQVYRRDRQAGTTVALSLGPAGQFGDGPSFIGGISDDGNLITFSSDATNLVPNDTNNVADVFLRDVAAGTTIRVSEAAGVQGTLESFGSDISADGQVVVFASGAALTGSDTNGTSDVFRWTGPGGTPVVLSTGPGGGAGNDASFSPVISADGAVVAYNSFATDLVAQDTNDLLDGFVVPTEGGPSTRVTISSTGAQAPPPTGPDFGGSFVTDISGDGRFVVFDSFESLDPRDSDGLSDVYIRDRLAVTTERVDAGNDESYLPAITRDGTAVAFASLAGNLVPGDTNNESDVFVAEVTPASLPPGSAPSVFVPIDAVRVMNGAAISAGQTARPADIAAAAIPVNATAVAVNVTLAGVTGSTFVSVCPGGVTVTDCSRTSVINADAGRDVADLAFPSLGTFSDGSRGIYVYNNRNSVIAYLDVVGYFVPAAGAPATGRDFIPQTPTRDTETLTLGPAAIDTLTVDNVPAGATAVAVRLIAAGVSGNTFLSACPGDTPLTECRTSSALNARQRDTSNLTIVEIGGAAGNDIQVYNNQGSAIVLADVVGFFTPQGTGSHYVAIAPTRLQEAEPIGVEASSVRSYGLLPDGVSAVAANITTAGTTAVSYVSVCPGSTSTAQCRTTSTVNTYPGSDLASSTMVAVGNDSDVRHYNNRGSTLLFTDLQGYFLPAQP